MPILLAGVLGFHGILGFIVLILLICLILNLLGTIPWGIPGPYGNPIGIIIAILLLLYLFGHV